MARAEAYQETKQRIEAARQEGATELDPSGIGLTELPEAIASLTQLQTLDRSMADQTGGSDSEQGESIRAQGSMLRELHVLIKEKDKVWRFGASTTQTARVLMGSPTVR